MCRPRAAPVRRHRPVDVRRLVVSCRTERRPGRQAVVRIWGWRRCSCSFCLHKMNRSSGIPRPIRGSEAQGSEAQVRACSAARTVSDDHEIFPRVSQAWQASCWRTMEAYHQQNSTIIRIATYASSPGRRKALEGMRRIGIALERQPFPEFTSLRSNPHPMEDEDRTEKGKKGEDEE